MWRELWDDSVSHIYEKILGMLNLAYFLALELGKDLVDAAKATGIQHFVWSTLDDIEGIHVYHFMSKYNGGQ